MTASGAEGAKGIRNSCCDADLASPDVGVRSFRSRLIYSGLFWRFTLCRSMTSAKLKRQS